MMVTVFSALLWLFVLISDQVQSPQMYIDPSESSFSVGELFTVDVKVSSITNLSAFEFRILFDKAVLSVVGSTRGALWNDPNYLWHAGEIDNSLGSIGFTAGAASSGSGPIGVNLDANGAVVFTITFRAIASGTSQVSLEEVLMCYVNGDTVSVEVTEGSVTVNVFLPGRPVLRSSSLGQ